MKSDKSVERKGQITNSIKASLAIVEFSRSRLSLYYLLEMMNFSFTLDKWSSRFLKPIFVSLGVFGGPRNLNCSVH